MCINLNPQVEKHIQKHMMKCTDLSKADSFHNVFVCQRQDLISTHCIPHLSAKVHKGAVNSDLTLGVCVCQCNMCECRGCFIQETKSEDTYMQKTHSKLSVQNCFLCDIHVIEQVRASSYKSVRMTGTSIYWLKTDSWKIRTFSGTKDLAVVSLNCPCFAGTKG